MTRNDQRRDERGATAVEYGLMLGMIGVAIIITVGFFGQEVLSLFQEIPPRLGRN
ncbi:Flp family type IVb pilin [Nocardioides cavernae]|uniref:Flp family type IVb pilin n=1 Tax=Nocardioides cavernae TaxID=1921566 RepID=A0ABR8NFU8_9ACTN|nr:Flp family type IVb pilin [Nocardioides cavernae]MBD3926988.1 Flp family type IVb pilin [Nocardioides cavernae]MBM7512708.1 Flp pilus assembly pilin Flp [Nocardioides cavernae]